MVSALAMSAQASWRLGREPEATDGLINDAGSTEGQKEEVILHDCILAPAVHALLMPRAHNPKEEGKLVSRDHLLQNTICKAFCHVFNLYTTVLFTDHARLHVAKPDSDTSPVLIP